MKINVVKDKAGKTIATFETAKGGGAQIVPALKEAHQVEELEVPENYKTDLSAIYA